MDPNKKQANTILFAENNAPSPRPQKPKKKLKKTTEKWIPTKNKQTLYFSPKTMLRTCVNARPVCQKTKSVQLRGRKLVKLRNRNSDRSGMSNDESPSPFSDCNKKMRPPSVCLPVRA